MSSLSENPFSYKITDSDKIIIYRNNKQIMIVKGEKATKLKLKIIGNTKSELQLVLAKITGNYKRGNERNANQI